MEIHAELANTVIMITHDVDEAVLLSDRIVMMTNGPAASIGEVLEIDLPRPRDRVKLAGNEKYNHYRQAVLQFLYERQRHPGEATKNIAAPKQEGVEPSEKKSATMRVVKSQAA